MQSRRSGCSCWTLCTMLELFYHGLSLLPCLTHLQLELLCAPPVLLEHPLWTYTEGYGYHTPSTRAPSAGSVWKGCQGRPKIREKDVQIQRLQQAVAWKGRGLLISFVSCLNNTWGAAIGIVFPINCLLWAHNCIILTETMDKMRTGWGSVGTRRKSSESGKYHSSHYRYKFNSIFNLFKLT